MLKSRSEIIPNIRYSPAAEKVGTSQYRIIEKQTVPDRMPEIKDFFGFELIAK